MSATTYSAKPQIDRDEIVSHLQQVLADRRFVSAERNANFLRYVAENTLNGKASEIKETVIATEVYGRSSDYDPKVDSIVRVEASRLRRKLQSYYASEGRATKIRIQLPVGSYVPLFERCDASSEFESRNEAELAPDIKPPNPNVDPIPVMQGSWISRTNRIAVGSAVSVLALLLSMRIAGGARVTDSQDAEAISAWQEGKALLDMDPHTAQTRSGPPSTLLRALERFEYSVARNPSRAQSWASLAEAYDYASSYVGRNLAEDARRVEAAARQAILLDNKLAAGHQMLGLLFKGITWDFPQADLAYRRALELNPTNAYAVVEYADLLWETGHVAEAFEQIRKARAVLPALPVLAVKEVELQLHMGRADAAMVTAKSAVELQRTSSRAHVALGMAYERTGDFEAARARYEHVLRVNPTDRRALPVYGYLLAATGQSERAKEIARDLERINANVRNCAFQVAVVYAGLGEDKLALDWLETAWRTRQSHFPFAAAEYRFRKYHQNPRFRELLGRIGLKPVA